LVCFESAVAHVHWFVSLLGFTPGLLVVLGVPEQLSNLDPPGVIFVCESEDGLDAVLVEAVDCVFDCACSAALACAVAEAFALGPADELDWELSSAFFAWPLFSAEAEAVTLAVV
jgi:hypothetical protein